MRWRPVRVIVAIVAVLMIGFSTAYVSSGEVRYLTRAGLEETQILTERKPIAKVLRNPDLDPAVRGQLELVLQARDAAAGLGLAAEDTYTPVHRRRAGHPPAGPLGLAARLSLPGHLEIPDRGSGPLQGVLRPEDGARRGGEARRPGARHLPAPLGGVLDPGVVQRSPPLHGARRGFGGDCRPRLPRGGPQHALREERHAVQRDLRADGGIPVRRGVLPRSGGTARSPRARRIAGTTNWCSRRSTTRSRRRLDTLYASKPDSAALAAGRAEAGRWSREQLEGPVAGGVADDPVGRMADRPVNNARLIAARIYRAQSAWFEEWYQLNGADIRLS